MDKGFILVSRSLLDSDVFASQKLLKIWIWCLCKSNFKDRTVPVKIGRGESIVRVKRGSFIFGRHKAEYELCIKSSTVWKLMKNLEVMEMVTINSNSHYSVVTVCNYESYQDNNNYKVTTKGKQKENKRTTKGKQSNTTNTLNTLNTLNKRKTEFKKLLAEHQDNYPKEMITEFFDYWTEHSPNDKKMRHEKQTSFDVNRRLKTWLKRSNGSYDNDDRIIIPE